MPDEENDLQDDLDEAADAPVEGEADESDAPQAVTTEELQTRVNALEAELRAANTKNSRDLIAAIGRVQSLQQKVDAGSPDAANVASLRTQMTAVNEMLDAVLDDETVDPKVKARATAARTKAQGVAEQERITAMQAEIDALKNPKAPSEPAENAPTSFEAGVVTAIEAAGLDPDDELFDWKGEASTILTTQGPKAALAYFKKQIAAGLEAKATAGRRQTKKDAAGTQGARPSGDASDQLDPSRSAEDRYKYLKSIGAI